MSIEHPFQGLAGRPRVDRAPGPCCFLTINGPMAHPTLTPIVRISVSLAFGPEGFELDRNRGNLGDMAPGEVTDKSVASDSTVFLSPPKPSHIS